MSSSRAHQALHAALMSALFAAQPLLFVPVTLYTGNAAEFSTGLMNLLPIFFQAGVFMVGLLTLPGLFLSATASRRYLAVLCACTLLSWLQSRFLVWDYGLLDGRQIDWTSATTRGWLEAALWAGTLALAASSRPAQLRIWINAACVASIASLVATVAGGISHLEQLKGQPHARSESSLQKIVSFSGSRNVLHIVADGLQTDIFEEILVHGEAGRRIDDAFNGFTVFSAHVGAFPFTHMSVPALLSGVMYRNDLPIPSFLDATVGHDAPSILNAAAVDGFDVDIAVAAGLEPLYARGSATHVYSLGNDFHITAEELSLREAAVLFDLSAFRVAPHFLKRQIYNDQRWFAQNAVVRSEYMGLRSFAHSAFLHAMAEEMTADRPRATYKMLHVMTSHNPMATTEDCKYAGRVLPTVRETVIMQARCGLLAIAAVIERMKSLGIHDSTTIVVMGDHGAWSPPPGIQPQARPDGTMELMNPVTIAMASPFFAVKPPKASGQIRRLSSPSSIVDTAPTIASTAGIPGTFAGKDAFLLTPNQARERWFHLYEYQRSEWHSDYLAPIKQYTINGSPLESSSWSFRGTLYPGGEREPFEPQ